MTIGEHDGKNVKFNFKIQPFQSETNFEQIFATYSPTTLKKVL
jgi:hypothetical protein